MLITLCDRVDQGKYDDDTAGKGAEKFWFKKTLISTAQILGF